MYNNQKPLTAKDFKEGFTGICKFAFWCMFLYYVGLFHLIASFFRSNMIEEGSRAKQEMVINKFVEKEYTEVKNRMNACGKYSPREYFEMLRMVYHLEDSVGIANGYQFTTLNQLQQYMIQSVKNGLYSWDEIDQARDWFYKNPLPAVQKLPKIQHPHICERYICHLTIPNLFNWILYVYLHMLPFVFGLFLIWIWQRKDPVTLSLKSPLSFLLLVFLHPVYMTIIIARAWISFFREWTAHVEIRRRKKNIFEKLSKEERAFIKAFAKNALSFKEFFQWAETLGKRRHIAIFAVVATVLCSIPYAKAEDTTRVPSHDTVQTADTLHNNSIDIDIGHQQVAIFTIPRLYDLVPPPALNVIIWYGTKFHFLLPSGYQRDLEPIPLYY